MKKTKKKLPQVKTRKQKVSRTTKGLRDLLFEEIDLLRQGKIDTERANAVSRGASVIINSAKLELEYKRTFDDGKTKTKSIEFNV